MAFISLLDDRAKPKGSRDPLGFELVWSRFGREVVGNLTTITSSLENFAVALLGFHWANELVGEDNKENRQSAVREVFLRYEQLAGYLRYYANPNSNIMGVTRITERVENDGFMEVPIGTDSNAQILSDQASYGLWGLYSSALRDSGLIEGGERNLTERGLRIAVAIEQQLDKSTLINLLQRDALEKTRLKSMADGFSKALHEQEVTEELIEALMAGSDSRPLQAELWQWTKVIFQENRLQDSTDNTLGDYINQLKTLPLSDGLKKCLSDIETVERVLVALNNIFHFCQVKDGVPLSELVESLNKQAYDYFYLPEYLPELFPPSDFPRRDRIQQALSALKANDYEQAIKAVLALNAAVMKQRDGAPWVELEPGGQKIKVKVKNEAFKLASNEELVRNWDYDYFLGSYLSMAGSYLRAKHG
jgi:hypothetical protein